MSVVVAHIVGQRVKPKECENLVNIWNLLDKGKSFLYEGIWGCIMVLKSLAKTLEELEIWVEIEIIMISSKSE